MFLPISRKGKGITDPFESLFGGFFQPLSFPQSMTSNMPRLNVWERDDAYVVEAEVPGIDPDNIEVRVSGDVLTIMGRELVEKEEKNKEGKLVYQERRMESFSRSLTLPGIREDRVDALCKDGILTLTLKKEKMSKKQRIAVRRL
jgi:HSP20 family molecular chaperone IbpA